MRYNVLLFTRARKSFLFFSKTLLHRTDIPADVSFGRYLMVAGQLHRHFYDLNVRVMKRNIKP